MRYSYNYMREAYVIEDVYLTAEVLWSLDTNNDKSEDEVLEDRYRVSLYNIPSIYE